MGKEKKIKGYKGFNPDLTCRGFQYEVGKEYEEENAKSCNSGFHFCENPFDVFGYYAPCDGNGMNRFCEVEGSGEFDTSESDKIACTKIRIGAEIGLKGIIDAGVKFIMEKVKWEDCKKFNTGYRSAATNTGYYSAATNTGDRSAATNTGNYSAATNTGNYSAATNTGNYSAATNTGYYSAATNTGDRSAATNTGDRSAATNTGDYSAATNTGDYSAATVKGSDSIAIVTGKDSKAKGSLGCWIVLTERGEWNGNTYPIISVKAFKVDGESIKEDTFYTLVNSEAIETQ